MQFTIYIFRHQKRTESMLTLLQISGSKRIHEIHLWQLISEIYKTTHSLNPSFMQELFNVKESRYSLRNQNLLSLPATNQDKPLWYAVLPFSWKFVVEFASS